MHRLQQRIGQTGTGMMMCITVGPRADSRRNSHCWAAEVELVRLLPVSLMLRRKVSRLGSIYMEARTPVRTRYACMLARTSVYASLTAVCRVHLGSLIRFWRSRAMNSTPFRRRNKFLLSLFFFVTVPFCDRVAKVRAKQTGSLEL